MRLLCDTRARLRRSAREGNMAQYSHNLTSRMIRFAAIGFVPCISDGRLKLVTVRPFLKFLHIEHVQKLSVDLSAKPAIRFFLVAAAIEHDDGGMWVFLFDVGDQKRELFIDRSA